MNDQFDMGQQPGHPQSPQRNENSGQGGPDPARYWSAQDQQGNQGSPPQSQIPQQPNPGGASGEYRQPSQYAPGYPPPQAPQRPYQYNANTGWQQPPGQPWRNVEQEKQGKPGGKKKKSRGVVVAVVCVICVIAVGLVALTGYGIYSSLAYPAQSSPDLPSSEEEETGSDGGNDVQTTTGDADDYQMNISNKPDIADDIAEEGILTIPEVAKKVTPSVVGIVVYSNVRFLEATGTGSGIIMSESGYIVTNAHVVEGADTIFVYIGDDDENSYEATLVGADTQTDLAVIKVEAEGLVAATFGDSDLLEVGETVLAIGNPAGLELAGSVTQGIVSAVNRQVSISNYTMNYIQTDAAINPGNSGGALVNQYGQVIGINSSKLVQVGYEGIGFAIPINEAEPVINALINSGRVTGRVMLGISGEAVNEIVAESYGVPTGVQIVEMTRSDLSGLGVRTGDIITHIDGERVKNFDDIRKILDQHSVGDTVTLTLYRQTGIKQNTTLEVEIPLLEDTGETAAVE